MSAAEAFCREQLEAVRTWGDPMRVRRHLADVERYARRCGLDDLANEIAATRRALS